MKSNLMKNVLDWVLATGVLLSMIFAAQFYFRTKELRALNLTVQQQAAQYQQTQQIVNMLVNETFEYSKAHPDVNLTRILDSVKSAPTAATQKPAAK